MAPRTFGLAPETETLDTYKAAFDAHLDGVAQSRGYDNRLTIATYATSSQPLWMAEAVTFISWRDKALISMFATLKAVENGAAAPNINDFINSLPVIDWSDLDET